MRRGIIVGVALFVGALHFLVGPDYGGPFPGFVNGYLIDIVLPFAMVLVTGLSEHPAVRSAWLRALAVFMVGAATETLQLLGVPIFGRTFDPLDCVAIAAGVLAAVLFEITVLSRLPRSEGR